jgi:multiple sugar transport system permease protein
LFPFAWAVLSSLKTPGEILIVPIQWLPKTPQWGNYRDIFTSVSFARSFLNSLIVSGTVALSVVLFGSMGGFALAKYRFAGQNLVLTFVLSTMMIPYFVLLMPSFYMVYAFGWVDTFWALIVPVCITAFGIFFMRQFIEGTIPDELLDAGRIDGCSDFRLFVTIVMPLCKSAGFVLFVMTFIANWNEFLWPLVVTSSQEMYTVQVLLASLQDSYGGMRTRPLLMAGTTIAVIPGMLLFLLVQRQIVQGISVTGFK